MFMFWFFHTPLPLNKEGLLFDLKLNVLHLVNADAAMQRAIFTGIPTILSNVFKSPQVHLLIWYYLI